MIKQHERRMIVVCALHAVPHYLGHATLKYRSEIVGMKRRVEMEHTCLSSKRRRLMFNETELSNVEFKVTFDSGRDEGDGGSENNKEQCEQKVLPKSSPVFQQKSDHPTEQAGKNSLESDTSTPRKGNGKMVQKEKRVDKIEVVGPQMPSPLKQRRVRGSLSSWINKLRSKRKTKKSKNLLIHVAKEVENAPYYTRSVNKLVISELICGEEPINQLSTYTDRQQESNGLEAKTKSKQKFGLNVERDVTRAWKVLLIEGTAERFDGFCPEVSFIYGVGNILGPRVHTPWKGSVLDSVIGALLSQRVGDNTSSSAFMSLGMVFPQHRACDQYSRHHRILRGKRSNVCSSEQISARNSTIKFLHEQGNVSKLVKQNNIMPLNEMKRTKSGKDKVPKKQKPKPDWKQLREACIGKGKLERDADKIDSVDWCAVIRANVEDIAEAILIRGMNKKLAVRIKNFLNRLVLDHGNLDLEWLRNADPQEAKNFLLSIYGFGLKSAECVRLLTLRQPAFPVDINVARVTVRLGWVPVPPVSDDIQMHILERNSSVHDTIHGYLWTRLSKLDEDTLYQLHCQMITFGKVFCTKKEPNCVSCPLRFECRYYSNQADRPSPSFQEMDIEDLGTSLVNVTKVKQAKSKPESERENGKVTETAIYVLPEECIEAPKTPVKVSLPSWQRITFKKNISVEVRRPGRIRTRTEHFIYELPDWHPILESFDDRDPDDQSPYLLVTWDTDLERPGETSTETSASTRCGSGSRTVPGTIMIPYRTALRGNFPLNATHFQANEVFADWETDKIPIDVPCKTLLGLPRKTLVCGANLAVIAKGRSTKDIHRLFHEAGYICIRFFDRGTYATRTLDGRLHKPTYTKREKRREKDVTQLLHN
ncbi:hypothetical protein RND81_02G180000 [Saponaria officinalis]|uniref:HhH-GPD domain-containing protein n=2 Tax=Saponaria officinalis TaxID=3572 RepID=A0AAW1MVM4_SAPOF